jgi:UDP:flavonoid glycosyltransferase YjiC (YdhE family)
MRLLFNFAGGSGHLEPMLPLAYAAQALGHSVAFCGRPWMRPQVTALGFEAFGAGPNAGLTPIRKPLAPVNTAKDIRDVGTGFGRRVARGRAADLLPICAEWRPDLMVCEEMDFGAMVAAEELGLPHAMVLVIAAGSFIRPEAVAEPLNEVRTEHGLPPDPELAGPSRYLVLSPFAPSYRDPAFPLPATAYAFRVLTPRAAAPAGVVPWPAGPSDAPKVYFTLGTIYNMESGDLFQRVLAGLRALPIRLIVTVGRDFDLAELGPQPANVRLERFIPQAALLPECDLVVSHGGSGSVTGALAHGLPMVLVPMGADQPLNAARCEALGVARALDALTIGPEDVSAAARHVLAEPGYRQAAGRLRDEIAALPAPEQVVHLLERVAVEKQPIRREP